MIDRIIEIFKGYTLDVWAVLPRIVIGLILATVFILIGIFIKHLVQSRMRRRREANLLTGFIGRIIISIFVVVAIIVFLGQIGLAKAASGLLAGAGVTAIILGFAFRDIGENFLSGFFLAFSRPFRIGDVVEINGITGNIRRLNLRNSLIRTFDGKDAFVPNSMLIKNILINYTRDGLQRHEFSIGLDYDCDLKKAIELMLEGLQKEEEIEKDGSLKPLVIIDHFGTSTINLKVYFWTNDFNIHRNVLEVQSFVKNQVLTLLQKNGFSLPADIIELKVYQKGQPIPVQVMDKGKEGKEKD